MNEIEKLYENCGIKPNHTDECKLADIYWNNEELADEYGLFDNYIKAKCPHNQECTDECEHAYDKATYSPFTAEKQIRLIIFLSYEYDKGLLINLRAIDKDIDIYDFELFGECLAKLVNELWQSLTEEEKEQIKEILI